jgi:predicted DsbA family dithiol-disulfide isomerase
LARRLNDKDKQKIISDYISTHNYCETARMNNVTEYTCRKVVKDCGDDEVKRKLEQKHQENTLSTIEYIQSQAQTKNRIINKLYKAIEEKSDNVDMFTNIRDLAMAYGILVDKELKILEIQKSQREINNGLDKVQQLLDEIYKEANK